MLVGYARVSTDGQSIDLQIDALRLYGCKKIFRDKGLSGASRGRPGLDRCLAGLEAGDDLVVWKLDRLGRSLSHLVEVVNALDRRGIGLVSLSEAIDTGSAGGVLIFHIMAALAEFERALISERTKAGMRSARLRGRHLGRPRKLDDSMITADLRELVGSRGGIAGAAQQLGVSRATVYRALRRTDPGAAAAGTKQLPAGTAATTSTARRRRPQMPRLRSGRGSIVHARGNPESPR